MTTTAPEASHHSSVHGRRWLAPALGLAAATALAAGLALPDPTPMGYSIHTSATAPQASRAMLAQVETSMGFVPNMLGALAESPAALQGYVQLSQAMSASSLTELQRQIVMITASVANGCDYCAPAHKKISIEMLQLDPAAITAAAENRPITDSKLEALRTFTLMVIETRGDVGAADLHALLSAGYTRAQSLEIVLGVTTKTLSNFSNRLMDTPLDDALR